MAYVCMKAGIPSRGYLNDVMKGKRRLNLKYTKGICRAFGLSSFAAKYLSTLIRYENEPERKKQLKFEAKIKLLRKILAVSEKKDISSDLDHAFCFKLFACFGLFDSRPTGGQFIALFPKEFSADVERALVFLENEKCIVKKNGRYYPANAGFMFRSQDWREQYLTLTLLEAQQHLKSWIAKSDLAIFESSYISVERSRYEEALGRFRNVIEEFQADIEATSATDVVQFSIQIFPLFSK